MMASRFDPTGFEDEGHVIYYGKSLRQGIKEAMSELICLSFRRRF